MNTKEIRRLLTPKGEYTRGELESYSELSSGKIKAAIVYKNPLYTMPLFDLIEDKDTSVGSEVEKRTSSLQNKFYTHKAGAAFNESVDEIIEAAIHTRLFGVSVIELYLDENGEFAFEFVPREYYAFDEKEIYLTKGKTKFKPLEPKYYVIHHKPALLKVLWIVYAKHFVLSHYMKFAEFLGVPPLIGNAHSSDSETIDQMAQAFNDLKSGAYAVLGPEDIVKVLEGRGNQSDFMEFVRYADSEIAKVLNGASLGSNVAASGSYAQSKSHEENRSEITKSDVRFATRLAKLLFKKIGKELEINIAVEKDIDLLKRAQTLQILKGLGYDMNPEALAYEFDLPNPAKAANARVLSFNTKMPNDNIDAHMQSKSFNDALKAQELEIFETIQNIAKESGSYEEVFEKLTEHYATMEFKTLDEIMFKAIANNLIVGASDGE